LKFLSENTVRKCTFGKRKDNTPGESWWVDEGDLVFISRGIADGKVKSNNGGPAVKHDFKRDR
jgi:hypothetical protein